MTHEALTESFGSSSGLFALTECSLLTMAFSLYTRPVSARWDVRPVLPCRPFGRGQVAAGNTIHLLALGRTGVKWSPPQWSRTLAQLAMQFSHTLWYNKIADLPARPSWFIDALIQRSCGFQGENNPCSCYFFTGDSLWYWHNSRISWNVMRVI